MNKNLETPADEIKGEEWWRPSHEVQVLWKFVEKKKDVKGLEVDWKKIGSGNKEQCSFWTVFVAF